MHRSYGATAHLRFVDASRFEHALVAHGKHIGENSLTTRKAGRKKIRYELIHYDIKKRKRNPTYRHHPAVSITDPCNHSGAREHIAHHVAMICPSSQIVPGTTLPISTNPPIPISLRHRKMLFNDTPSSHIKNFIPLAAQVRFPCGVHLPLLALVIAPSVHTVPSATAAISTYRGGPRAEGAHSENDVGLLQ